MTLPATPLNAPGPVCVNPVGNVTAQRLRASVPVVVGCGGGGGGKVAVGGGGGGGGTAVGSAVGASVGTAVGGTVAVGAVVAVGGGMVAVGGGVSVGAGVEVALAVAVGTTVAVGASVGVAATVAVAATVGEAVRAIAVTVDTDNTVGVAAMLNGEQAASALRMATLSAKKHQDCSRLRKKHLHPDRRQMLHYFAYATRWPLPPTTSAPVDYQRIRYP